MIFFFNCIKVGYGWEMEMCQHVKMLIYKVEKVKIHLFKNLLKYLVFRIFKVENKVEKREVF